MPIPVVCPGCGSRFTVSDKFAGKSGPCPKCRQSITIPASGAAVVTIHEPEPTGPAAAGRAPTTPFRRSERPLQAAALVLTVAGAVVAMAIAWLLGLAWRPGTPPAWLLLGGAFLVALPLVTLGYAAVRERELEPYSGRSLAVRALVCATVYAGLWGVRGMLPTDVTAEVWQWMFLGPMFFVPGALAALASFELDWGPAAAHFSFYVLFTSVLRWLAGLPPL